MYTASPLFRGAVDDIENGRIVIEVANSITVTPENMSGASYSPVNDNNAVVGHEFSFTLTPNPGYGLNPTLNLGFYGNNSLGNIGNISNIGFPEERTDKENGTIQCPLNDTNYTINYTFNAQTGVYTITLPAEMFEISNLSEVRISASFDKVYSVMFDLGDWVEYSQDSGGVGSRFFIYQVKQGEQINTALREEIFEYFDEVYEGAFTNLLTTRAGFTFKGFYATDSASSLASYGTSFVDYCAQGNDTIRGSLNYYARWNYTAKVFAPQGVSVRSALGSQLIETVVPDGSGSNLIPIDTAHGFSFTIQGTI